jgi:hypothetical protein
MPSDLQVSNIKDLTGSNTGLSIASDGQVTIAQNNPTVTLGSNTTFGSGVSLANATFPDGMVINEKVLYTRKDSPTIATSNTNNSFVSTGIDGTFVTKASSTDADMLFILYSGMMHTQGTIAGETAICLTTSSNTSYSTSNDLQGGTQYKNYIVVDANYSPTTMVFYNHFISYSAGDTLHWRVFFKKNTTDGNNFYLYHTGSTMYIIVKEILK